MAKRWVAAGVLIVMGTAAVAAGAGYWLFTRTPTYALWQVRQAMRRHDLALFRKYVDTRSVAQSMVEDFAEAPGPPRRRGLVELMRPRLTATLETQIEDVVEGTAVPRRPPPPDAPDLKAMARRIRGLHDVRKDGAVAVAHFALAEPDGTTTPTFLDVKLRRLDGYWQIFELPNLVSAIRTEQQGRRP